MGFKYAWELYSESSHVERTKYMKPYTMRAMHGYELQVMNSRLCSRDNVRISGVDMEWMASCKAC